MKGLDLVAKFNTHDWFVVLVAMAGIFLGIAVNIQVSACALCMTQRFAMVVGAVVCATGLIHNRIPLVYPILAGLIWIGGIGIALRQLWLQYIPGAVSNCGPSLDFLLANDYPVASVLRTMISGSGDCAEPSVIPLLALVGFVVLLVVLGLHLRSRTLF